MVDVVGCFRPKGLLQRAGAGVGRWKIANWINSQVKSRFAAARHLCRMTQRLWTARLTLELQKQLYVSLKTSVPTEVETFCIKSSLFESYEEYWGSLICMNIYFIHLIYFSWELVLTPVAFECKGSSLSSSANGAMPWGTLSVFIIHKIIHLKSITHPTNTSLIAST